MSISFKSRRNVASGTELLIHDANFCQGPDALGSKTLSIALIGPEEYRRKADSERVGRSARQRNPRVLFLS